MTATILIVDDEDHARQFIATFLTSRGYEVLEAPTLATAKETVRKGRADIILLDVQLPDGYGLTLLDEITLQPMRPPVIVITAFGDIEMAVEAMRNGAHDFLTKPVQFEQLEKSIHRAEEIVAMRREVAHMRQAQHQGLDFIIGKNPGVQDTFKKAERVAMACVSALITGQSGTGKDILVRYIHKTGPRADKPFIAQNCAAIQSTVLESELFGYEAGAFTGAEKRKHGIMEVADEGILFLDEISAMPLDMQAKLLRIVEDQAFRRVGGTNLIHVDVQIIAASNRDLPGMIADNKFREDLYYRLKVVNLDMPPLKERKEDIPDLVGLFIRQNNAQYGMNITDVTPRALAALIAYDWPGNIRELRHVIDSAMIFCDEAALDISHLPPEVRK